jgi:UDP-N-acetylglucosamine 2-epimerase
VKVLTVVGARPQFIKAAPVSRALREAGHEEVLVHTGQHYDYGMSRVFFDEMGIPEPDVNLEVGSGTHGQQVGQILMRLEEVIEQHGPRWVLVYGDTNSTLAGALAAAKLQFPVAHVEAGLRSFNRAMPEEINRVVADHLSELLLCPSRTATENLRAEGITRGVHLVGDVMYDAVLAFAEVSERQSTVLSDLGLEPKKYTLATVHRAENTDDPDRMRNILAAFAEVGETVVFPVHPRTRQALGRVEEQAGNLRLIEPQGYLDMLMLERQARMILTDSGGIQKEAYWLGVPCVTLRDETEWVETIEAGWNVLAGADSARIVGAVRSFDTMPEQNSPRDVYGEARASERCVRLLQSS